MRLKFIIACVAFFLLVSPVAASPSIGFFEIYGGLGGDGGLDQPAAGAAGGFYLKPAGESPVAVLFRPAFDWHKLDNGNNFFFSGNVELEFSAGELVTPSVWIGGGLQRFQGKGPSIQDWLASGSLTIGVLNALRLADAIHYGDANGALMAAGCEIKVHLGESFYVAPAFTFQRGFGGVSSNNIQTTLGAGVVF